MTGAWREAHRADLNLGRHVVGWVFGAGASRGRAERGREEARVAPKQDTYYHSEVAAIGRLKSARNEQGGEGPGVGGGGGLASGYIGTRPEGARVEHVDYVTCAPYIDGCIHTYIHRTR